MTEIASWQEREGFILSSLGHDFAAGEVVELRFSWVSADGCVGYVELRKQSVSDYGRPLWFERLIGENLFVTRWDKPPNGVIFALVEEGDA